MMPYVEAQCNIISMSMHLRYGMSSLHEAIYVLCLLQLSCKYIHIPSHIMQVKVLAVNQWKDDIYEYLKNYACSYNAALITVISLMGEKIWTNTFGMIRNSIEILLVGHALG